VHKKIENIEKNQHLSSTTADEVQSLQNRISQAIDRLEILKNDYFSRLDNVELELKNRLIDHKSDQEIEVVIESQILVERLEEEVEAINYYLQAVDEIGWR
jgi:DNA-binding protein